MSFEIVAIGSPLLDYLIAVDEGELDHLRGKKFGTELVSDKDAKKIIECCKRTPTISSGGSSANVVKAIASLGHTAAFIGKCGEDDEGARFSKSLIQSGVHPRLMTSKTPTGKAVCLITPDGRRTMRTYPGASVELLTLPADAFIHARWVHIEGYALYNDELVENALRQAKESGAKISFDLASFELAKEFRERILGLLKNSVDLVFGNALEIEALVERNDRGACKLLSELCPIAVVMQGDKGALIGDRGHVIHVPAHRVTPVDTTGAGDYFIAGFLHGLLTGAPLKRCGEMGAILGREIVQVVGAELDPSVWKTIKF